MNILEKTVNQYRISEQNPFNEIEAASKMEMYAQLGFVNQANNLAGDMLINRIAKVTHYPLLRTPNWESPLYKVFDNRDIWRHYFARNDSQAITLHRDQIGVRRAGILFTEPIYEKTFLIETSPAWFRGEISTNILQATIDAKHQGLLPRVWFVCKEQEIPQYMKMQRLPDPAMIGYPITTTNTQGEVRYIRKACFLIGIWGSDLYD